MCPQFPAVATCDRPTKKKNLQGRNENHTDTLAPRSSRTDIPCPFARSIVSIIAYLPNQNLPYGKLMDIFTFRNNNFLNY